MSQTPTQTIHYAPPAAFESPARRRASRQCLSNGIGSLSVGMFAAFSVNSLGLPATIHSLALAACILTFFSAGILKMIASQKIRRPNSTWELLAYIAASIEIAFIALWIAGYTWLTESASYIYLLMAISTALCLAIEILYVHRTTRT